MCLFHGAMVRIELIHAMCSEQCLPCSEHHGSGRCARAFSTLTFGAQYSFARATRQWEIYLKAEIYFLTLSVGGSPKLRCQQGWFPLRAVKEGPGLGLSFWLANGQPPFPCVLTWTSFPLWASLVSVYPYLLFL